MGNDKETVEQVCDWLMERDIPFAASIAVTKIANPSYDGEACMIVALKNLRDRIHAAHEGEMNALAAQKTAEASEAFIENAKLADAIMAKDVEIERLSALIGELADTLEEYFDDDRIRALVKRAREVVK